MATKKPKKPHTVWVRVNALVGFKVCAENPEQALEIGREELEHTRIISEDVEYMDGDHKVIGVLEDD